MGFFFFFFDTLLFGEGEFLLKTQEKCQLVELQDFRLIMGFNTLEIKFSYKVDFIFCHSLICN